MGWKITSKLIRRSEGRVNRKVIKSETIENKIWK